MEEAPRKKILVVDDDTNILMLLELYLKKENFDIVTCENGLDALTLFREENPDLVLLDVMLPGMSGFEVLAEIRKKSDVPIIMLTARGSTADRVEGLENGADDYVSKPFDSKELIARIKAVLRRTASQETEPEVHEITFKGLYISMDNYYVTIDDVKIDMTPKETELLFFLMSHAPNVFTREELLAHVWDLKVYGDTRTVDVHIKRIREKLGAEYAKYITTVWAVGYKFDIGATTKPE